MKEYEEIFRSTFEQVAVGMAHVDLDGKFIRINQRLCDIFKYSREELLSLTIQDITYLDDRKDIIKARDSLLTGETSSYITEKRYICKDKSLVWGNLTASIAYNSKGEYQYFISVIEDITEKKKAEQKLRESEKKYRGILENMIEGYFENDLKGNYTFMNNYFCKILGYTREELLGKNYRFNYNEKRAKEVFKLFNQLYKNEISPPLIYEDLFLSSSGETTYIEGLSDLRYDSEGKKIGFYGFIRNITERKNAEQKLKESEKKYREILENIKEGYFEVDLKGNFTFVNDYLCKILGYSKEELLGTSYDIVYDDKRSKEVFKLYNQLFKNEISPPLVFENQLLTQSGKIMYYEALADVKYDSEGNKVGFFGLLRDITERKIVEHKLIESEVKYRDIIENAKEGYYETDLKGNFTFFNKALCELLKYSPEETMGLYYKSFIDEENTKKIFKAFNEVYRTGIEQPHFQYEIDTKNGERLFGETTIYLKYDSDGRKIGFCGFLRDITEKKIAEQNLQQSEKKYREILENMREGYFEVDLRGNLTFVNDYYCKLLGHSSRDEVLGKNYGVFQDEKTSDMLFKIYNQLYKNEIPSPVLIHRQQLTPSGETIYYEVLADLKYDSEGNKVGFFGLLRDITERTEAEQRLKNSEEKFRLLTEQSLMGIGILQDDLYKYVNQEFANILGYTIGEILNWKPGEYLKIIYTKDRPLVREQATKKQKGKNDVRSRYELRIIKKTGEIVWVEIFSGTIIYEGKTADLITFSNITERKRVETVLEEQQKELEVINELKSEFLRRASHELKTPLISIKGFTNLLLHLHREEFNPDVISMLFEVDQGCQRLEDIIQTIIQTTKLESSTLELHTSDEDLSFLIRFCIKELNFLLKSRDHTLIVNIQDKIITKFNKEQIYEVITNLLSNSIKYTPPKGEIRVQTELNKKNIVVSIQDNGIGFTESEKKKIFQQFGKIERYGQGLDVGIDGTGLGLHISKKIIELHKGKIWMESDGRNRGSTFYFSLPLNST